MKTAIIIATLLAATTSSVQALSQAEKNEAMNNNVATAIANVRAIYEKPKPPKKVVKPARQ
jgi:hypothetical protein